MSRVALALLGPCCLAGCQLLFTLEDDVRPTGCSPISMLADDFSDGNLAPNWRLFGRAAGQFEDVDGRARILAGFTEVSGIAAAYYFDLREGEFSVDVSPELGFAAGDSSFTVELISTIEPGNGLPADRLLFTVVGGQLIAGRYDQGMSFEVGRVPYDPIAHRRWKIEQRGTRTRWQVASATGEFSTIQQFENLKIQYVKPHLEAFCMDTATGCHVSFDNVNGGTPSGTACPVGGQKDAFASTADPMMPDDQKFDFSLWHPFEVDCRLSRTGGHAVAAFNVNEGAGEKCFLETSTLLDASSGTLSLELVDPTVAPIVFFAATAYDDKEVRFQLAQNMLVARDGTSMFASATFDPEAQRFWRFRGDVVDEVQSMVFEVSGDGTDYTFFARTGNLGPPGTQPLDRMRFRFGVDGPGQGAVLFDNVNRRP